MNFKEQYKIEKGFDVDVEVGGLNVMYYSEDYVEWLEKKLKKKLSNDKQSEQLSDANKHECDCSNVKDQLDCSFECYNK